MNQNLSIYTFENNTKLNSITYIVLLNMIIIIIEMNKRKAQISLKE